MLRSVPRHELSSYKVWYRPLMTFPSIWILISGQLDVTSCYLNPWCPTCSITLVVIVLALSSIESGKP